MTLQLIGRTLSQLTELLEEYQDELAFTDMQVVDRQKAIAEIELAISEWIKAEVQKADNIAGYLRREEAALDAADREIELLKHRQVKRRERLAQLEQYVLEEMRVRGKKRIDGTVYSLRRQTNGGVLGVDVRQPELLPEDLLRFTLKMTSVEWTEVRRALDRYGDPVLLAILIRRLQGEPDLTAIRKELEKREKCPLCAGTGYTWTQEAAATYTGRDQFPPAVHGPCSRCDGKGEVPTGVPGCSLKERGEHLRVEPA